MFLDDSNFYSRIEKSNAFADATPVHVTALQSGELISKADAVQIAEQRESTVNEVKPTDLFGSNLVWLLPVWGAIVWLLLFCTASEAWKLLRHNVATVKPGQRVPCKNCRYFSSNFYLKCAVRPSDALTERAVDCSDFCQKLSIEESKPQSKHSVRR